MVESYDELYDSRSVQYAVNTTVAQYVLLILIRSTCSYPRVSIRVRCGFVKCLLEVVIILLCFLLSLNQCIYTALSVLV